MCIVIGIIITSIILIISINTPLGEQVKNDLYSKQQLIQQDSANITQITGASVYVREDEVEVIITEQD